MKAAYLGLWGALIPPHPHSYSHPIHQGVKDGLLGVIFFAWSENLSFHVLFIVVEKRSGKPIPILAVLLLGIWFGSIKVYNTEYLQEEQHSRPNQLTSWHPLSLTDRWALLVSGSIRTCFLTQACRLSNSKYHCTSSVNSAHGHTVFSNNSKSRFGSSSGSEDRTMNLHLPGVVWVGRAVSPGERSVEVWTEKWTHTMRGWRIQRDSPIHVCRHGNLIFF